MDEDANGTVSTGGVIGARRVVRRGRFVTVAAPLALVALASAWLFLGATPARTGVLWCSMVLLATCLVILGMVVARVGGHSRRDTYRWAVRAAPVSPVPTDDVVTVPSTLAGPRWLSIRCVAVFVAVPALLALWATLVAADTRGTGRSAVLGEAGAVIEQRPIVKIENQVVGHRRNGVDVTADFTVLLPSPTRKNGVPATFEASVNRLVGVGSNLYVGYVPERPELGAVGHVRRVELERQLAGRAVGVSTAWGIGVLWALVTLGPLACWWKEESPWRPTRTVTPAWRVLRVTVAGIGQHTDQQSSKSADPADEEKRQEVTRWARSLLLEHQDRAVPFHSLMEIEAAGAVLSGARGWLLWHPEQRRGRNVLAELVGDDGWHLPGAVPVPRAEGMEEAGLTESASPDPERRVRTLDFGADWLMTASAPVVMGFVVAFGCMAALLLVPDGGAWRWWTTAAGALTPGVGFTMQAMARDGHGDGGSIAAE
ncbi:hypothetical protein [Streptomyces sp. Root369]|uniref:hypothetical protein n=1 Tax=Streptomyces sp. Root369 TaxID=1736523 RepID=UPI001F5B16C5|nr:hypothetical protein [Streptomyces sp. Root369]